MEEIEKVIVKPSLWVNIGWYILSVIGFVLFFYSFDIHSLLLRCVALIPILWALWKDLEMSCWNYIFGENPETMKERKGVFTVTSVEIQYFRIKSVQVYKPFFQRIFGLSTLHVITSEPFKPHLTIYGVKHGDELAECILEFTKYWRAEKGVKESDFHHF